jgi:DNA-binding transcriptional LysR family regulator
MEGSPVRDLNDVVVFVKVAQLESISGAARAMGMPVSTVSRRVSALEAALGATLLQRTTRRLALTAQGRAYLDRCSEPLSQLADAEHALANAQRTPEGLLRISVPVILGQPEFLRFISDFLRAQPRIQVDLRVTNELADLIAENVDVGIRFGALDDSSLVTQKLGTTVRWLAATPAYLKGRPAPSHPSGLADLACVLFNAKNNEAVWDLESGRRRARVRVSGPVATRDFQSAAFFTAQGHGVGLLPTTYCEASIRAGALVRVLPEWTSPKLDVHAVYPTRRFLPARLLMFLQALKAWRSPLWLPG